jgi:AcrR family transcriptional regulator
MREGMSVKERREREEKGRLASILQAAEKVFARSGYYQARMDDIAEEAELAKGTLYYYFKSKDEIYIHLLKREAQKVHERIRSLITEDTPLSQDLQRAFTFYLEYFDENPAYLKMFLPCMCGTIQFESGIDFKRTAIGNAPEGAFIRETLKKKLRREGLPFGPEDMMKFLKTLQIGIGFKLLEGHKDEAKAAVRFFLDLMKRVMEEVK